MCKYLSAIATKENLYVHDALDSHEDLIAFFELKDDSRYIVRLEFCPDDPKDLGDIKKYKFNVDQASTPEWWEERKEQVESELKDRAKRNLVTKDRDLLAGGAWIICEGVKIKRIINARLISMMPKSYVGEMRGSSNVGVMMESSNVGVMMESSNVGVMRGSSNVGVMRGSSRVGEMRGSSNVGVMMESSNVGVMRGSSNVGVMWGSSNVGVMRGSSNVGEMWGSSRVGVMRGSSNVGEMWGSSNVGVMRESAKVEKDHRQKDSK